MTTQEYKSINKASARTFWALLLFGFLFFTQSNNLLHEIEHLQTQEHTKVCQVFLSVGLDLDSPCVAAVVAAVQPRQTVTSISIPWSQSYAIASYRVRAPPIV